MGCLGVHFALTQTEIDKLKEMPDDESRLAYLLEDLETHYFKQEPLFKAETDKAWDAIHRSLTDGRLGYQNGEYPLNHAILGGELLYEEDDYIMSLKTPRQVDDIAQALGRITRQGFQQGYDKIPPEDFPAAKTQADFDYTWHWFQKLLEFWQRAAAAGRYVLFTADQ